MATEDSGKEEGSLLSMRHSFFEIPSNIVLKLMRPSVWIAIIMFAWGLVVGPLNACSRLE